MKTRALAAWIVWAFVLGAPPEIGSCQTPIHLEEQVVFSSTSMEITGFALSPDNRWIAYEGRLTADRLAVFIVPSSGGDPTLISDGPYSYSMPAWSPDTRYLYFIVYRSEEPAPDNRNLMRVPFDSESGRPSGPARLVSTERVPTTPVISPDGRWVAYAIRVDSENGTRPQSIRVIPSQGGPSRELARVNTGIWGFLEDSQWLLFAERSVNADDRGVYRVPLEGGDRELLFPIGSDAFLWELSGDGKRLLWSRNLWAGFSNPLTRVITDVEGNLITGYVGEPRNGNFSYDGSSILYWRRKESQSLILKSFDGGLPRVLKDDACINEPVGWAEQDQMLFFEHCPDSTNTGPRVGPEVGPIAHKALLMDPATGASREVPLLTQEILDDGYGWALHPDGRHLLVELRRDPDERPIRTSHMIMDLETGEIQDLNTSPEVGLIYGNDGNTTNGEPLRVLGDRFLLLHRNGEELWLMTVRPGELPVHLWTYPPETVREFLRDGLIGRPIGVHGSRVAWIRTNYEREWKQGIWSTLMITDTDTDSVTEVFTTPGLLNGPTWSRDGRKIAIEYDDDGGDQTTIAVVALDDQYQISGEPKFVETGPPLVFLAGWTADNENLFFEGVGIDGRNERSYFLISPAPGSTAVDLTGTVPDPSFPALLSPNGASMIYPSRQLLEYSILRFDLPNFGGMQED